jgi:hypothetical protein
MGHHRSSSSRPMLRFILSWLVNLVNLLSLVLTAYFWYSRVLTTGISVPAHAIDTLVRLAIFSVRLIQRGRAGDWYMVPAVVFTTGLIWSLCARLEWVSDRGLLFGVRRRRAAKGERVSAREDVKLTWLMRAGVSDTDSDDVDPRLTSHPLRRSRSSYRPFFSSPASSRASQRSSSRPILCQPLPYQPTSPCSEQSRVHPPFISSLRNYISTTDSTSLAPTFGSLPILSFPRPF